MFKLALVLILCFLLVTYAYSYSIHDYGWEPYRPGGLSINNFGGGTRFQQYQYEPHFSRSCGLACTQYARASDFGSLDSRHTHYDYDRHYNHDINLDHDRNYNHDINPGPD